MAYTREQARQVYNAKMQSLMLKIAKRKQEEDDKDRAAWQETQAKTARKNAFLSLFGMYKDLKDSHELELMGQTYADPGYMGVLPKKFERKDPRSLGEVITQQETLKRLLPGKLGAYRETEGYKEFKIKEEEFKKKAVEELEKVRGTVPLDEEHAIDERIAYERLIKEEDVWTAPMEPAPLDMAAIDESTKRDLHLEWLENWRKSPTNYPLDAEGHVIYIENYDEWLKGIESGQISAEFKDKYDMEKLKIPGTKIEEARLVAPPPPIPEVPIDMDVDEAYIPELDKPIEEPLEYPTEQLEKIQAASEVAHQEQQLQDLRDIQTTPGVAPTVSSDPALEKALQEMERLDVKLPKAVEVSGAPVDFASTDGFVKPEAPPSEATTVPDAKPGFAGKAFEAGQTALQLANIGKTITDEKATDEQKAVASVQGTKLLTDLSTKIAGQKTVSQIGSKAATKFITGKGLQEGVKLTGKQAAGAVLGGALGGYTMVKEAEEAGEAWEEEDYDEAILHGMGSASGGLQTAGAGMMATGIGAPLGAVLYGIGTAGSVISSTGLILEGLFGGDKPAEVKKPKFDYGNFFESIRRR